MGDKAAVEIRLLGGFGLLVDGKMVPVGSWRLRKAKDAVALLALAPGHRRHRDEVIEALWPERDMDSGLNNLHQALHIARRGLAGAGTSGRGRLRVRDEWVALCPEERLRVDVEDFETAADAADAAGDPQLIESALTLYRGDLLPEDRYDDWLLTRRDELRARRRRLTTRLATLREEGGDPQAAIDLLGPLVADDPSDEVAQRALIRGYALNGDRGAALRRYRALVVALRDSLAVPPDAETEQVYQDVLAGRLSSGPAPAGTNGEDAARRAGASRPAEPGDPPRRDQRQPGQAARTGTNLPLRLSTFIGRDAALADLAVMLGQRRLITLTGPGGGGKSRLAVEVAQRARPQFPDGVWLADLAAVSGTEDVVGRALTHGLGLSEHSGQLPLEAVAADLAEKRSLLVIDNCEHRIDAAAGAVAELLAACPDVVVLATSREPLRVPGEVLWPVQPLDMPDPRSLPSLVDLDRCESVRLFVDRTMAADPDFFLDDDNAAAVAEICFRLDGLPLAIELAAARVPALGVGGVAERLDDRFRLLTSGSRTALSRQRTLAATFDWSYELLSELEQTAFRRVAVFAETFSLRAAGAVAAGGGVDRDAITVVLPDLVGRSMISIEQEPASFRYRLIETLREYGRARLAEAGETDAVRQRHAAWYQTLAQEAASHFADPGRRRWFERIDADQADFQAALSTLADTAPAEALDLAAALWPYWIVRSSFGEGLDRLVGTVADQGPPSATRVEALVGAFAIKMRWAGAHVDNPYADQALETARALGDPLAVARSGFFVGVQAWMREDFGLARSALLTATAMAADHGLTMAEASTVHGLACVAWSQGQAGLARRHLDDALDLARRGVAEADQGSFWQLTIGGIVTAQRPSGSRLVFEDTYVSFQENRGLAAVAYIRASMGSLARSDGDYDAAGRLLEDALALFEESGDEAGVALACGRLGNLAAAEHNEERARQYLTRSLAIRRDLRDQRGIGTAAMSLGRLEAAAGHLERAAEACTEASGIFRASGDLIAMVGALTSLGELHLTEARNGSPGQANEAVRLLESAVDNLRVMGHGTHLAAGLSVLAEAYAAAGEPRGAARAAAEAIDLLGSAPAEAGRDKVLLRLSALAGQD